MKKLLITSITFLLSCYCIFIMAGHNSVKTAQRPELIKIEDVREVAQLAQTQNLPILIMFGTDECPYCRMLKEDFLIPMLISGDYVNKVIIREAHISSGTGIIDFSGKKISMSEFANRYKVRLFPTMVFVDSKGLVLVKNIRGITTPSLFGGTIDDAIDRALLLVTKKMPLTKS